MSKSISITNGTTVSQEHNRRNKFYTDKQAHIDKSLKNDNIIFVDENLKSAYNEIFGSTFSEWNARQRKDRQCSSYYEKIKNDPQRNLVYECIVQVGNADDTGLSNAEQEKQALKKFYDEWEQRNPNLKIVGAYLHCDEATPHLHIDYIPVAYKNKRGMQIQNSISRALQEQGHIADSATKNEESKWLNSERIALEKICYDLGINAKANQGISTGRGHLSKGEFIMAKEKMLSEITQQHNELNAEIIRKTNAIAMKNDVPIPEMPEMITQKNVFGKEKQRPLTAEERKAKQQEIDFARKQNEINQQIRLMQEREQLLQAEQERLAQQKAEYQAELTQLQSDIAQEQNRKQAVTDDIAVLSQRLSDRHAELKKADEFIKNQVKIATTQAEKIAEELKKRSADELQKLEQQREELQEQKAKQSEEFNKMVADYKQQYSANVQNRAEKLAKEMTAKELNKAETYNRYIQYGKLYSIANAEYQQKNIMLEDVQKNGSENDKYSNIIRQKRI